MKHLALLSTLLAICGNFLFSQPDTIPVKYDDQELKIYLSNHLQYPDYALKNKLMGIVKLEFRITEEGCAEELTLLAAPHESFSNEVKEAINNSKCKWTRMKIGDIPQPIVKDSVHFTLY